MIRTLAQPDTVLALILAARTNFAAFVTAVHRPRFVHSYFSLEVCRAVDQFVEDVIAGKRPVLVLTGPPQHGKEIAHHVPVLTQNRGWITHGDLRVGDRVYRPDGTNTPVVALSPDCESDMRVTLADGSVIDTHSRHEWQVRHGRKRIRVMETQEMLAAGLWHGERGRRGSRAQFQLPPVAPLRNETAALPVAPYALGVWLGDGERTSGRVTVARGDAAMLDAVEACGYPLGATWRCNENDVHANFPGLRDALRQAGMLCNGMADPKRIPDAYFTASYQQRLELLAGLIDSDGYVYPANGRVTFSNTEPELVRSVERLVATFGWRVTTTWFDPHLTTSGIQGVKRVAQVCFQPDIVVPCAVDRYRAAFKPATQKRRRSVVSIERGSFGPGRCIQVAHPDGMYLVGDKLVPTHNSSLISRCLPPYLFGRLGPQLGQANIACASYALSRAAANARDAKAIMAEPIFREIFPHASMLGFRTGVQRADEFTTPAGELYAVGVGGPLTGKSVHVGLIDDPTKDALEALSQTTQDGLESWYDAVFTTRLQQRSGQVIMGTPWSAHDLIARVHDKHVGKASYRRLQFVALNYPDEVGYNPDQPVGPLVPALHTEEKLREIMATMAASWWAAMYQQAPLAALGAIFNPDGVRYYRRADLPPHFIKVVLSVDAAFKDKKSSDYVAAGVWGKTVDGRVWLLAMRREKLSFTRTAAAIVDLKRAHKQVGRVLIEDAANGPALIDQLSAHIPGIVGVPPSGSKESRASAVSWVWENGQVMLPHPDDMPAIKPIVSEIIGFPDTRNDDAVDCMVLALQDLCLRDPISSMITADVLRLAGRPPVGRR